MTIEDFREYCLSLEGVTEKMPFGKFARRYDSLLVFYVLDHMFALVDIDDFTSVTVKLEPDVIEELRMNRISANKPVNLSEKYWIQLDLNGDITGREIFAFAQKAYEIVKAKYGGRKLKHH